MKCALYIGTHDKDDWLARVGYYLTRHTQKGAYGHVTHCEAIHAEHTDGSVTIASASLRDKGVRAKIVHLNPAHWLIADVPQWDVAESIWLLSETAGRPYDWRGALATRLPGNQDNRAWFCSEWLMYPYIREPATFGPHHLAAICMSIGRNVTAEFFKERDPVWQEAA